MFKSNVLNFLYFYTPKNINGRTLCGYWLQLSSFTLYFSQYKNCADMIFIFRDNSFGTFLLLSLCLYIRSEAWRGLISNLFTVLLATRCNIGNFQIFFFILAIVRKLTLSESAMQWKSLIWFYNYFQKKSVFFVGNFLNKETYLLAIPLIHDDLLMCFKHAQFHRNEWQNKMRMIQYRWEGWSTTVIYRRYGEKVVFSLLY